MASDARCEFCAYWRTPVDEGRNICTARAKVTEAHEACIHFFPALPDLPFTDDTVGSDAEVRALHEGRVAMGAGE